MGRLFERGGEGERERERNDISYVIASGNDLAG